MTTLRFLLLLRSHIHILRTKKEMFYYLLEDLGQVCKQYLAWFCHDWARKKKKTNWKQFISLSYTYESATWKNKIKGKLYGKPHHFSMCRVGKLWDILIGKTCPVDSADHTYPIYCRGWLWCITILHVGQVLFSSKYFTKQLLQTVCIRIDKWR